MSLKDYYIDSLTTAELIIKIGENLSALESGINSHDIDFQESKKNLITTIEIAEKHLLILQKMIRVKFRNYTYL